MFDWNPEQKRVIETLDKNVMVSASAGSGKTTVMIERTIRLILEREIPVSRIVMLSFNNDIAAEIREKMRSRLIAEAEKNHEKALFIAQQIDAVGTADISTFHSFCKNIILRYPEYAGRDTSFGLYDENTARAVLNKSVSTVFDRYYEDGDKEFIRLCRLFSGRGDAALRDTVFRVYAFVMAQLDREDWLCRVSVSNYLDFDGSAPVKRILREVPSKAEGLLNDARLLLGYLEEEMYAAQTAGVKSKRLINSIEYAALICEMLERVTQLNTARDICGFGRLHKKPSVTTDTFKIRPRLKVDFDALVDRFKMLMGPVWMFSDGTYEEFCESLSEGKKTIVKLCEIVARVTEEYNKEKAKDNRLDFNDLEYYAVKVLKNERAREDIKAGIDYIMVDEYQDINYVQEFIINAVSGDNNLFTVGDSKQSIYKFRLTEPSILLERRNLYKDGAGVSEDFNSNYRSDDSILGFVNDVFAEIMTSDFGGVDYKKDAMFKIKNKHSAGYGVLPAVSVAVFCRTQKEKALPILPEDGIYSVTRHAADEDEADAAEAEGRFIAEKIQDAVSQGYAYKDIAILIAKRNERVNTIIEVLKKQGIPVDSYALKNEEGNRAVSELLQLLKTVYNFRDDYAVAAVMSGFFGGFTHNEMLEVRRRYKKEKFFSSSVRLSAENDSDALGDKCREFVGSIDYFAKLSGFLSVAELLEKIIEKTGYCIWLEKQADGDRDVSAVMNFVRLLQGKSYSGSLSDFLYASENLDLKISVPSEASDSDDKVKVMTVHASKGLEFPVVFVADAGAQFRHDASQVLLHRTEGIAVPDYDEKTRGKNLSPVCEYIKEIKKKEELEERMRLLYVALTRAKNRLFVSGGTALTKDGEIIRKAHAQKAQSFLDFIYTALSHEPGKHDLRIKEYALDELPDMQPAEDLPAVSATVDTEMPSIYRDFVYGHEESVSTALKNTVTSINHEDENLQFYVPSVFGGDNAVRGTSYHKVMELIDYELSAEEEIAEALNRIKAEGLIPSEEEVDPKIILTCLKSDLIKKAAVSYHVREKAFMLYVPAKDVIPNCNIEDKILVQGTVDLIIFPEDGIPIIVDYKKSGLPSDTLKEKYKTQINIYRYAVEKCYNLPQTEAYIYVLGQDKTIKF